MNEKFVQLRSAPVNVTVNTYVMLTSTRQRLITIPGGPQRAWIIIQVVTGDGLLVSLDTPAGASIVPILILTSSSPPVRLEIADNMMLWVSGALTHTVYVTEAFYPPA